MTTKKNELVLSKDNLLKQPMVLSLLPYKATVTQIKVINSIVRKLQVVFKQGMKMKYEQGVIPFDFFSIYDSSDLRKHYLDEDDIVFDMHLSELGIPSKHYPQAFNTLFQMAGVVCALPIDNGKGANGFIVDSIFKPIIWNDNVIKEQNEKGETIYKYKKPIISIVVKKRIANYIFSVNGWMDSILDYTVSNSSSSYEARLYIFLSSERSRNGLKFKSSYQDVRRVVGFIGDDENTYLYFSDFKRRVLEPAKKALDKKAQNNESDISFDYTPIYKNGKKSRCPDFIEFTINLSELGVKFKTDRVSDKSEIELKKILKEDLCQSAAQIKSLLLKIKPEYFNEVYDKAKHLIVDLQKGKITIKKDLRSYANKSLISFIENELEKSEETKPKNKAAAETTKQESQAAQKPVAPICEMTEAQLKKFAKAMNSLKKQIPQKEFETWFSILKPIKQVPIEGKKGNYLLTILVPSAIVYKYIEEKYIDVLTQCLRPIYGEDMELVYTINKENK